MNPILAILFTLFIAVLLGWALIAWWQERERQRALQVLGSPMGLRLSLGDPFDLPELHFKLRLFNHGHSRLIRNVLHGRLQGMPVRLFDYQYETGSGRNRRTHRWQVALVQMEFQLPGLIVQPAEEHDPLEVVFGFDDVAFQVEPFCQRFHVAGEDAQFAYQLLHPRLVDTLVVEHPVSLETEGQTLAVYRSGPAEPGQAIAMLQLACRIPSMIPEHLRQELRAEVPDSA